MLTEPLPRRLDICKAADHQSRVEGQVELSELRRFRGLLASDSGSVQGFMRFGRDEERRFLVAVEVEARVTVTCQRCLERMPLRVTAASELAAVWNDEQAAQLPRRLDPLLLEGQECDLWSLVEDELILAIPPFSYHPGGDCNPALAELSAAAEAEPEGEARSHPFNVLERLKSGHTQQE